MSLEIVAGLLGSQLVRAVASEVAVNLAARALQHAVGSVIQPTTPDAPTIQPAVPSRESTHLLRALPTIEVISSVPGRARLRVHGVRDDADRAAAVSARALAIDGVTSGEANPTTGTLLVHFDARRLDVAEIVEALEPPARSSRPSRSTSHLRLVVG